MLTGTSHSLAKTEFFILLASLKHVPPSVFPISVNVTIIYQLFKQKPWASSLTPPLHPPACHNPILAIIISLLDIHITLFVSTFLPLVPPKQPPCAIPDDANVHIQIMPSIRNPSVTSCDPRLKSNVHTMVSKAFWNPSISLTLPLAQLLHCSSVFTFITSANQLCSLFPQGLDTGLLLCENCFSPKATHSGLIYFHLPFLTLATMLFFSLHYPSGFVKTPCSLFPLVSVSSTICLSCYMSRPEDGDKDKQNRTHPALREFPGQQEKTEIRFVFPAEYKLLVGSCQSH